MIKKIPKYIIFLSLTVIVSFTNCINVKAEGTVKSQNVCVNNQLYNINWDTTKNTAINSTVIDGLTFEQIENGFIGDAKDTSNSFTSTFVTNNCYKENGKIYTCPSSAELAKYDTNAYHEMTSEKSGIYKYITFDYDVYKDKYTVKVKDLYNGKVKVRVVRNYSNVTNDDGSKSSDNYNDFLVAQNGYFIINDVDPTRYNDATGKFINSTLLFEFYLNDSSSRCNKTYIASLELTASTVDTTIKVDNPAISNPAAYGCDKVINLVNTLQTKGIVQNASQINTIKTDYASACYTKKIPVYEFRTLSSFVEAQYQNLLTLFNNGNDSGTSDVTKGASSTCDEDKWSEWRTVKEESGTYWSLVCKERYRQKGDQPKLVRAGGGFRYSATFTAQKVCTLTQKPHVDKHTSRVVIAVTQPPKCVYDCYAVCSYDTSKGRVTTGGPGSSAQSGPNEDFDNCVKTCDGGKYSQNCINSCYNEVYGNDRKLPETDTKTGLSLIDDTDYKIKRTSSLVSVITQHEGNNIVAHYQNSSVSSGWNTRYGFDVVTPHNCTVGVKFSTYCEEHNGVCEVYESVSPSGCSDTPNADYLEELTESYEEELTPYMGNMFESIPTGTYTVQIADSYLNNGGQAYIYEYTVDESNTDVVSVQEGSVCQESADWNIGVDNQGKKEMDNDSCKKSIVEKEVTITLPESYLNKNDGEATYSIKGRWMKFNAKTATTRLENTKFNSVEMYPGGKRYYTNALSDNVNVIVPNDTSKPVTLVDRGTGVNSGKAGISVSVTGLGSTQNYSGKIGCFYGVYNDTICKNGTCSTCPGCPDDTPTGDGLTIIFRPIDLTDNFPNNRSPRWNWTNAATRNPDTLLNYKVDPVTLNKTIENKGYSIYNRSDEVDYSFVLTPENIRAIRKYNKEVDDINKDGSRNYLDYDLSCYERKGRKYCVSKFMSNTNYITYADGFNSVMREDIAKCNNAKGGSSCDD